MKMQRFFSNVGVWHNGQTFESLATDYSKTIEEIMKIVD